jgi:hypothetical protein
MQAAFPSSYCSNMTPHVLFSNQLRESPEQLDKLLWIGFIGFLKLSHPSLIDKAGLWKAALNSSHTAA